MPVGGSTAEAAWVRAIGVGAACNQVFVAGSYTSTCLPTNRLGPVNPPNVYNFPFTTNLPPSARSLGHVAAVTNFTDEGTGVGGGVADGLLGAVVRRWTPGSWPLRRVRAGAVAVATG